MAILTNNSPVAWVLVIATLNGLAGCGGGGGGDSGSAGGLTLSVANAALTEGDVGNSSLPFTVTLSGPEAAVVTVDYATSPGSATAGLDYIATSGTLTFTPGSTSQTFSVLIPGDSNEEPDESFSVLLANVTGNAVLGDATATGTLVNDDSPAGGPFGLDTRPSNPTCLAPPRPDGNATVATVDAFPTAPAFAQPTKILQPPGDGSRWFVLEKGGLLKVFSTSNPSAVTTWLDLAGPVNPAGEGGLLGLAFHPNWPATREVFISYTTDGSPLTSRVSRFILDSVTQPVNVTEQILLTVNQPFDNHNGGDLAFGPDGYLYFGLGDGGSANDPNNYAQNNTRLLGKMLRIDVASVAFPSPGYRIPADNPFAANVRCGPGANAASCPEIYATGLRNPWRWSFDAPTGDLWLGDVGQGSREEVNRIRRGGNYGWDCREGFIGGPSSCSTAGLLDPVSDYPHADGDGSITGGYVYRGTAIPVLRGRYVFADFSSGRIWALEDDGQGGYSNDQLLDSPFLISAFGSGADGELYIADFSSGRIRRLAPGVGGAPNTIPATLSASGCVAAGNPTQPAAGVIPYRVNAPFWSDFAVKERYFAIPDGTRIARTAAGDFDFPAGSVILKSFRLGGQLIETRLFMRHPDGVWAGYTYEWNAGQTEATRVIGGKTRQVGAQAWIYPSEGECMQCHTAAGGFSLGPQVAQLNGTLTYPTSGQTANQLATLEHINLFTTPLPGPPATLAALVDPADTAAPLTDRARAYLETNCAQCHRPGGPTPTSMDLRAATALAAMNTCNANPQSGGLGITNARVIAPGDAARSVLVARMNRRDVNAMPPIGSNVIDASGVALLTAWVNSLTGCL